MKEEVKVNTDDLIEIRAQVLADEIIEKEKAKLREEAIIWAEKKSDNKAILLAEKEKLLSLEMKQFQEIQTKTKYFAEGEALPKGLSEAQAVMIILMGAQMGMTMFEALQGIGFVNGKMIIYGEVMIGRLTKAGYKLKLLESNEKICTVTISGSNGEITETFKIEQAQKAGWVKGFGPWKDQPHLMLRYKAIRQGMKFLCPEVMSGLTTYEEAISEIIPDVCNPGEGEIQNNITNKFK